MSRMFFLSSLASLSGSRGGDDLVQEILAQPVIVLFSFGRRQPSQPMAMSLPVC